MTRNAQKPDEMLNEDVEEMVADDNDLSSIAKLAEEMLKRADAIVRAEEALKIAKAEHAQIEQVSLPNALLALGMRGFTLADGRKLELTEAVIGGLTKENKPEGFKWLRKNKLGAIIKRELKLGFPRGKGKDADAFLAKHRATLKKLGVTLADKVDVHPGTLQATIREMVEKGVTFPPIFGVMTFRKVELKTTKQDKNAL